MKRARCDMTLDDLKVGHTYRGKRSKSYFGITNDRTIVWMGGDRVQYDADTLPPGRRYPIVAVDKFLRWAKEDITPPHRHMETS